MSIEEGTKYQISQGIKSYFNSAKTLTVVRQSGITVQFILEDNKGRGSMPLQHLQYLLKKEELTQIINKASFISSEEEEQIG